MSETERRVAAREPDAPASAAPAAWNAPRSGPPVPAPREEESAPLPASLAEPAKPLSPWVKPLIWIHRLLGGSKTEHRTWHRRIEAIEQAADIDREPSTEGKAILADRRAWQQMKATGLVGASGGLGLGAAWMVSWLLPTYAVGHGIGWPAACLFLLPVPFAWRVGRRLWERASLQGMKELGPRPTAHQQLRTLSTGMLRGMAAGAGMGFTLVFLQGWVSWLWTPAPTLIQELAINLFHGTLGAAVGATAGAVLGPLVGRPAPSALPSDEAPPLLPEPKPGE